MGEVFTSPEGHGELQSCPSLKITPSQFVWRPWLAMCAPRALHGLAREAAKATAKWRQMGVPS